MALGKLGHFKPNEVAEGYCKGVMEGQLKVSGLSWRQAKATIEAAKGLTNLEVGAITNATQQSIKCSMTEVYRKLGVKNRNSLIVYMWSNFPEELNYLVNGK